MKVIYRLCFVLLAATSLVAQEVDQNAIIDRARATLGAEADLDSVVTLRMVGRLEPADMEIPSATLLIVVRKPSSQRMEIRVDDIVETTILNGTHGCIVRSNLDAGESQMRDLVDSELERVSYSTRQFFNFYRPDFRGGERVSFEGIETRFDQRAYKLKYAYPEGMETVRYFSVEDDTLVSTLTQNGVESVSSGTQIIKGIKFPERIEYYEGDRKLHTIILEEIEVNKPLAAGIFDIPR